MDWKVILTALSLLRELLKFLKERRNCKCNSEKARRLAFIRDQVKAANSEGREDLEIIV